MTDQIVDMLLAVQGRVELTPKRYADLLAAEAEVAALRAALVANMKRPATPRIGNLPCNCFSDPLVTKGHDGYCELARRALARTAPEEPER